MAELHGRVTGVTRQQGTGALEQVSIDGPNGTVTIYKADAWLDDQAFQAALGKTVDVRVVVTVAL